MYRRQGIEETLTRARISINKQLQRQVWDPVVALKATGHFVEQPDLIVASGLSL